MKQKPPTLKQIKSSIKYAEEMISFFKEGLKILKKYEKNYKTK